MFVGAIDVEERERADAGGNKPTLRLDTSGVAPPEVSEPLVREEASSSA